jgi:predicted AAA+ superfamily ATPase
MDEVQRLPEVFAPLRSIIDKERRKRNKMGQFLFLGSASIDLLQQSSESLAGRIAYIRLHPVDVLEYADNNPDQVNVLWLRSGFPESLLAGTNKNSAGWRHDFIKTYLKRDIPQLGHAYSRRNTGKFLDDAGPQSGHCVECNPYSP